MAEQDHYSLRWNNHQTHILRAFSHLLESKNLVDVTLVCSDTSISAHKVVLSACSPFFERIFAETPCKHPVIVLKDFNGSTIRTIVDFMYHGHISVRQEKLTALMQAGQSLQVRGLVDHSVTENKQTPVQSPDNFMGPLTVSSPGSPALSTFDEHPPIVQSSASKLPCPSRLFVDRLLTNSSTEVPDPCTSPIPRRKQARPRRRSGDSAPYDLTKKSRNTPNPPSMNDNDVDNTEDVDKVGKEKQKELQDEERPESSLDDEIDNLNSNEIEHENDNDNDNDPDHDHDNDQEPEQETEQDQDNEIDEQNEDIEDSSEVPENLCTKNTLNNNNESLNNKNNSNRIVLSLKDIRHLNRSSYRHHPFSVPPNHSDFTHAKNHNVSSLVQSENMKREAVDGRLDGENSFLDQMDLTLAAHHHNMQMQNARHDIENNMHKEYTPSSPMSLPSHFNPREGLPHPPSPLQFPGMPSALTGLTPPHHMFGLDSPLLFPAGIDPAKLYNPLMEMSDPRGMLPDHHGHILKKKMTRPKGQHSAPRGGPPRSWTNAELTDALQHVWNKKMTTSQASRVFGIPYNSLLMYVRGKYGKSLKLEQLRKDCISGPPIELLQMGMGAHNNNNKMDRPKELKELDGGPLQRSSSSEPDLMSSPNAMFNSFPGAFYPEFPHGFPALPIHMLNLLPPERQPQPPHMSYDEDCKSDRSKQSIEDEFAQQLSLSGRDDRREMLQQNGQD